MGSVDIGQDGFPASQILLYPKFSAVNGHGIETFQDFQIWLLA